MSTANKFKRAKKTKLGLKDTINTYLGQNITDAIPFKDYETYIKNFYNSLPKTEYAEGSNITLSNTLKGKLDFEEDEDGKKKIGYGQTEQKSYEGYNLFKNYATDYSSNGITKKTNADGSITFTGTATANAYIRLSDNFTFESNTSYTTIVQNMALPSGVTLYFNDISNMGLTYSDTVIQPGGRLKAFTTGEVIGNVSISILIQSGIVANFTIYPMVVKGTITTSNIPNYEPYVGNSPSPSPSYPQDIEVVRGKNRVKNAQKGYWNNEGIWVNDTAFCSSNKMEVQEGKTYVGSMFDKNKNYINKMVYVVFDKNDTFVRYSGDDTVTIASGEKYVSIRSYTAQASYVQNNNFLLQFEKDVTHTSYLPYNTIEVVERGKNWFTGENILDNTTAGVSRDFDKSELTLNGTSTGSIAFISPTKCITLLKGTYTFKLFLLSGTYSRNNKDIAFYIRNSEGFINGSYANSGISFQDILTNTTKKVSFTLEEQTDIYLSSTINGDGFVFNDVKIGFQIESGDTYSDYEPYITPQTYQLSLGDKELYTDSKIVRIGKNDFKFIDKWKKIFIDSNDIEGISKGCAIISHKYFIDIADVGIYQQDIVPPILSNIDKSEKWSYINDNDDLGGKMFLLKLSESQNQFRLYLNATTVQEAKTNLDNSNAYFIYKTNTAIETPITDTTLINQLEEWYNSHSFNGTTIIEIDGQLPLIIKARALKSV